MCYNSKIMLVAKRPTIPSIMLAKLITYNSQSYAGTLGSGLVWHINALAIAIAGGNLVVCMRSQWNSYILFCVQEIVCFNLSNTQEGD